MHSFAQTNIQLFSQLRCAGYSDTELSCILNAYKLATRLFTGYFRGSGKTFIAHLVGTASILGSLSAPVEVVSAGLIHAAYEIGDFGDGSKGISEIKRQQVRQAVGQEIEDYVAKYTALPWNEQAIPAIYNSLDRLASVERNVLLIRLANELEDHLDCGVLYCGNVEKRLRYIERSGHLMTKMAQTLGFPTLSVELSHVFQATLSATIPTELRSDSDYSYLIPTSSYSKYLLGKLRYKLVLRLSLACSVVRRWYQPRH